MIRPDTGVLRGQVLALYKTLLYYGRNYPMGYTYFRDRCHKSFIKHKDETDPLQIAKHLSRGEFIIKELEALYRLKKYRYLKQRYYPDAEVEQKDARALMKQIERQKEL